MPTKYYLILSKTIGVQWLTNWIQWHDFNYHSKVYFSLFELESLLLNCPLWNCRGWSQAEVQAWCCHQPAQLDWCQLAIISRPTDLINSYWSYLFTLLSTLTLWKIHAGLNRDQRRLYRRQAILRQDGGRRTEKRQLGLPRFPQPSAPTIQTCLSHHFLGLGDVGFLIHHPSSSVLNPCLFYEMIKFCTTSAGKKFVKITPLSGIVWNCMIHFVF